MARSTDHAPLGFLGRDSGQCDSVLGQKGFEQGFLSRMGWQSLIPGPKLASHLFL